MHLPLVFKSKHCCNELCKEISNPKKVKVHAKFAQNACSF